MFVVVVFSCVVRVLINVFKVYIKGKSGESQLCSIEICFSSIDVLEGLKGKPQLKVN